VSGGATRAGRLGNDKHAAHWRQSADGKASVGIRGRIPISLQESPTPASLGAVPDLSPPRKEIAMSSHDRRTTRRSPLTRTFAQVRFALPAALAAVAACGDTLPPTEAARAESYVAVANAGGRRAVRIQQLTLASTTLPIGGTGTTYQVDLQNTSNKAVGDLLVQGEMLQGGVVAGAGGTVTQCPGSPLGVAPPGSCTFSFTAVASNITTSGGILVPGAATFVLHLYQAGNNGKVTELDSRSVSVTLVPNAPYISAINLSPTNMFFGRTVDYTILIENPTGAPIANASYQAEYTQNIGGTPGGGGGGGGPVYCSPTMEQGVIVVGTCTFPTSTTPSADPSISSLVEGPATFSVALMVNDVVVSTRTMAVNLSFPIQ